MNFNFRDLIPNTAQATLSFLLTFFVLSAYGQGNSWSILSLVSFEKQYDATLGMEVDIATVNPIVEAMDGQEIEVDGYIIPLDGKVKQSHFVYSAFPANMCFFCGKAGPETAMEVFMKDDKKVAYSDAKIRLKGNLKINESDGSNLIYTLQNAVLL